MYNCICVRLKRGDDIKTEIQRIAIEQEIKCGAVLSAVGCVSSAVVRDAGGVELRHINQNCEIVSLMGTVSQIRSHLHISLAKQDLTVIGGHLMEGCIVNTTCELIITHIDNYEIDTQFDSTTGYNEAIFNRKES